jgi:hypothetical protein
MCHGPPIEARRQVKSFSQSKTCGKIESSRTIEIRTQASCVAKSCISGGYGQREKTSSSVETD